MDLKEKRQKQVQLGCAIEQKEVMRAGIRETKGGDELEKICGRKNFQDLVIF